MLLDGVRFCDVCSKEIPAGENYVLSTIPPERAGLFLRLFARTENATKPDVAPDGSVELAICLTCKVEMSDVGSERVD